MGVFRYGTKGCYGTFKIVKGGIQEFVVKSLQRQHEYLLQKAYKTAKTRLTCSECNKQNLLPKHAKESCPSQKDCLCKKISKGRRPCPNAICDSLFEGIIESHQTLSPNLKNTDINRWTEDYWEIAKCFMAHATKSPENTDVMDLLHIMANNKMIRMKLGLPEGGLSEDPDDFVNKVIQACKTIRQKGIEYRAQYVETYQNMMKLLAAIGDSHARSAILQLEEILKANEHNIDGTPFVFPESIHDKSGSEGQGLRVNLPVESREFEMKNFETNEAFMMKLEKTYAEFLLKNTVFTDPDDGFQLDFIQRAFIVSAPDQIDNVYGITSENLEETTVLHELGLDKHNAENKCNNVIAVYSKYEEKDWLIDSIFRYKFQLRADLCSANSGNIIILTSQFASKLGIPLEAYCSMTSQIMETEDYCTIVLDLSNDVIESFHIEEKHEQKHKIIRLVESSQFPKSQRPSVSTVLRLDGIQELVLSNTEGVFRQENSDKIKLCLCRCFRKIGGGTLKKLTFENIEFEPPTCRVSIPFAENLEVIKLKASKLVPVANFIKSLELEDVSFGSFGDFEVICKSMNGLQFIFLCGKTEDILMNIKTSYIAWLFCLQLESISTSSTVIGQKRAIVLNIQKATLEKNCLDYFAKPRSSCSTSELASMIQLDVNTQLYDTFRSDHFESATTHVEKQLILDSICFCLLQRHTNYIDVYPVTDKKKGELLLMCTTREDRYMSVLRNASGSKHVSRGKYVGFKTLEKSIYELSPACFAHTDPNLKQAIDDYYTNHFDDINDAVKCHAEKLLNKHRNVVSVAVSLGKETSSGLDLTKGPHVVLYVRAKSFIPFGDNMFPKELVHDSAVNIKYPVDVREGFYIPCADAAGSHLNATDRLPMLATGCSIGAEKVLAAGTMGPLVQYKIDRTQERSSLGFLTACHLFRKPEHYTRALHTNVVQPSDADDKIDMNTGRRIITHNKICGKVVACKYSEEIDAALVRIDARPPTFCKFIQSSFEDLDCAGFAVGQENGMPTYRGGRSLHVSDLSIRTGNADRRIIKFGRTTGLKRGHLLLTNMAVSLTDTILPGECPVSSSYKVSYRQKYLQHMQVLSIPEKSFLQKGDSGCGVFLVDTYNELWCIGIGVGIISDSCSVVTPIHAILEGLQVCLGPESELRLKSFEPEAMIIE